MKQILLICAMVMGQSVLAADKKPMVPNIFSGSALYSGPVGKKGWNETKIGARGWNFSDGGFESNISGPVIGRTFPKMPHKARVEFDLEWKGDTLSLFIGFMTDNLTSYSGGNCYNIRLYGSGGVYVMRYTEVNGAVRALRLHPGSRRYSFGNGPKKVRIALCHDASKRKVAVIINGKLVGEWRDNAANRPALGNGLNFTSRTSTTIMRISRLTISEWSGNLPGTGNVADRFKKPLTKEKSTKVIEAAIRKAAKKPTGELTKADLEKVTELNLQDNQLTDVKGLEKLTQLKLLNLSNNSDLTKAQIDQLQKALPNCDIRSNPTK